MATYTSIIPSGSTNGRMNKVAATSTPGDEVHTAHATAHDEVYVWAHNSDTVPRVLTIELGGTTSPDDLIVATIPPKSKPVLVVPGVRVTGSVVVRAFASATNVVMVAVNVNRVT